MFPFRAILILCFIGALIPTPHLTAREGTIEFSDDSWDLTNAEVTTHLGRQSLAGVATLKDVELADGVIEVDVALTGARSYPGIIFRVLPDGNYERFYLRPHRAGLYPDALQYTPVLNGVAGWQLYAGPGFTAGTTLASDTWITVRLEMKGSQARVFLGAAKTPALVVHDLKLGAGKGAIGLFGPRDGTARFSNFSFREDDSLVFEKPPAVKTDPTVVADWEISRTYPADRIDRATYPGFTALFFAQWRPVLAEPSGLVDVARHIKRENRAGDLVFARKTVRSDRAQRVRLSFGYSDDVTLFLNGRPLFEGKSGYQSRDPSFTGIVGLNDTLCLDLEKGLNEIFLMVSEKFGGWGFMARADRPLAAPVEEHDSADWEWETDASLVTPESVLYDAERGVLYVSSFDRDFATKAEPSGFISKVGLDGRIVERDWITGLNAPTGMAIRDGLLYVVERGFLTSIDIEKGVVAKRHSVKGAQFLNDVADDGKGNLYISNSTPAAPGVFSIYRFSGDTVEPWLADAEVSRPNGLCVDGDRLLVGNTADGTLKAVGLKDKRVRTVARIGPGVVDGVRVDAEGRYLLSNWEGRVYRVGADGCAVEILNTRIDGNNAADFEYIAEKELLVVPAFMGNRVTAYKISG
jgi:sugar lactone lactonase YvrE